MCCASGVDLSGARACDKGSVAGDDAGEDGKSHKQRKGSQGSLDQPEQDPQVMSFYHKSLPSSL